MTNADRDTPPCGGRRRSATNRLAAVAAVAAVALGSAYALASPHAGHAAVAEATVSGRGAPALVGFWDNFGQYVPRLHCMQRADGTPDWPWIMLMIALNGGVVIGYARIFRFWR